MGLEKVKFFYFEPKFKTEFFFRWRGGGRGWLEQFFFTGNPIFFFFFFLGGGGGGGGVGTGWRTGGVGEWTDEQAQAFKCDFGLQPR